MFFGWGAAAASRDTLQYLNRYPGLRDDSKNNYNLEFYQNKRRSSPDGDFIDNIHRNWFGKWDLLEDHHGYIQWLFPIHEAGLNWQSFPLEKHEAEMMVLDSQCKLRVRLSYQLMLNFYGMELSNGRTGVICRSSSFEARYRHLNRSHHNCLRITRILKSLGELGFEHYKLPFIAHFALEMKRNYFRSVRESAERYWFVLLRHATDRDRFSLFLKQLQHIDQDDQLNDLANNIPTSALLDQLTDDPAYAQLLHTSSSSSSSSPSSSSSSSSSSSDAISCSTASSSSSSSSSDSCSASSTNSVAVEWMKCEEGGGTVSPRNEEVKAAMMHEQTTSQHGSNATSGVVVPVLSSTTSSDSKPKFMQQSTLDSYFNAEEK